MIYIFGNYATFQGLQNVGNRYQFTMKKSTLSSQAFLKPLQREIEKIEKGLAPLHGELRKDEVMFIWVSVHWILHLWHSHSPCTLLQDDDDAQDQEQHFDRGFYDSFSIIIYVNKGGIIVNGVKEECNGNSAVMFSTSVPHAGVGHIKGSIRIFMYIDFAVVPEIVHDDFSSCACINAHDIVRHACGSIVEAAIYGVFYCRE